MKQVVKKTKKPGLYTRNGVYMYRGSPKFKEVYGDKYAGRPALPVTEFTVQEAYEYFQDLESKCQRPGALIRKELTGTKLFDKYLDAEERRFRDNHLGFGSLFEKRYLVNARLRPHFADLSADELSYCSDTWEAFVDEWRDVNLKNTLKVFRHFLNWCLAKDFVDRVPKLSIPKTVEREGKDLGMETVWTMHQVADTQDLKDFLAISIMTGMRKMEILGLSKDRVKDLENDLKAVVTKDHGFSKTKTVRTITVNESVWQIIQRRIAMHPDSPWIFPCSDNPFAHRSPNSLSRPWNRMLSHMGLTDVRPNDLRTTWVNEVKRQQLPAELRAKYAGHSRLIAEQKYEKTKLQELQVVADAIDLKNYRPKPQVI